MAGGGSTRLLSFRGLMYAAVIGLFLWGVINMPELTADGLSGIGSVLSSAAEKFWTFLANLGGK